MMGKETGFINQTISNEITGLVEGNYVDLTRFCEVAELRETRFEASLFCHMRKSYPLLNMKERYRCINLQSARNMCNMMKQLDKIP